jgi:hypothetical protein
MITRIKILMEVLAMMFEDRFSPNKANFACCQCRLAFRQDVSMPYHAVDGSQSVRCPKCSQPMHNMGVGFVIPRSKDAKQWHKIELLVQHDFSFELLPA